MEAKQKQDRVITDATMTAKLRYLAKCPMGYEWHREGQGWRCNGGSHYVKDEELAKFDADVKVEVGTSVTRSIEYTSCERATDVVEQLKALITTIMEAKQKQDRVITDAAVTAKLRYLAKCPMGYEWHREGQGWRCNGGSHYVKDEELAKFDADVKVEV
eukprot:RCo027655